MADNTAVQFLNWLKETDYTRYLDMTSRFQDITSYTPQTLSLFPEYKTYLATLKAIGQPLPAEPLRLGGDYLNTTYGVNPTTPPVTPTNTLTPQNKKTYKLIPYNDYQSLKIEWDAVNNKPVLDANGGYVYFIDPTDPNGSPQLFDTGVSPQQQSQMPTGDPNAVSPDTLANIAWQREQLAYQKQKDADAAALQRQQWLTDLSKSPSDWIAYYEATHGNQPPPAPTWLQQYLGVGKSWGKVQQMPDWVSPMPSGASANYFLDTFGRWDEMNAWSKEFNDWMANDAEDYAWQQTTGQPARYKTVGGITPMEVGAPSGQWLNRNPQGSTLNSMLGGYADWAAARNKSMTWSDLKNQTIQMLPTGQAGSGRWQASKQKGW